LRERGGPYVSESVDDVMTEFIAFVNHQVGAYVDALAGFAGNHARVELQVHREQRPLRASIDAAGLPMIVWASYEDPSKPAVIHNRIVRAQDYLAANEPGGGNEEQHGRAILVFLFTYWEEEIRGRLAAARGVAPSDVQVDAMGDIRILRNVILHARGIVHADKYAGLKKLKSLFAVDATIALPCETMQAIFEAVKQDCAKLLLEWLGVTDAPIDVGRIRDFAIQRRSRTPDA
jgi:hypothetical protein